jgi:TRAP-type C4-dicarboxylate transport system permease small subunit
MKKVPVISIVLYVLAGLLLIFTIVMIVLSAKALQPSFAQGLTFKGYELEIINFYISNMGLSILFAILFFFLGFIYQKMETDAVYIDDIDFFEEDEDDDLVDELTEEVEEALE